MLYFLGLTKVFKGVVKCQCFLS